MIGIVIGILAVVLAYLLLRPKPTASVPTSTKQEIIVPGPEELALRSRLKLSSNRVKLSISVPKEIPSDLKSIVSKLSSVADLYIVHESKESSPSSDLIDSLPADIMHHRILLHSSRVGKIAILRQLKPDLHLEFDLDVANTVFPHLKSLVYYGICFSVPEVKIPVQRRIQSLDEILKVEL